MTSQGVPVSLVIRDFAATLDAFYPDGIGKELSILRSLGHVPDGPMHDVLVTPTGDALGSGSVPEASRDRGFFMVRIVRPRAIGSSQSEILASTRTIRYPANAETVAAEQRSGIVLWGDLLRVQIVFAKLDQTKASPWAGIDELAVSVILASIIAPPVQESLT